MTCYFGLGCCPPLNVPNFSNKKATAKSHGCYQGYSRVDTDVLMEVAYSCNFLAVSDSSTCPDIGTS